MTFCVCLEVDFSRREKKALPLIIAQRTVCSDKGRLGMRVYAHTG